MKIKFIILLIILNSLFVFHPIKAETINFQTILEQAINNSPRLKKSKIDVEISKAEQREVRADLMPTLQITSSMQYDNDLTGGQATLTSVGDTVLVNGTRYQNFLAMGLNYTVFDFGAKGQRNKAAKKNIEQKKIIEEKELTDLKVNLLGVYVRAQELCTKIKYKNEIVQIQQNIFSINEKLFEAKQIPKINLYESSIELARLINSLNQDQKDLDKTMEEISLFTLNTYNTKDLTLQELNLPAQNLEIEPNFENSQLAKIYDLEIEKKQKELSILKRERLPKVLFTTNYYFYGSDKNNYFQTFENFEDRSLNLRLVTVLPIFDGLKNKSQQDKKKLEIEKIILEKQEKIAELKKDYKSTQIEKDSNTAILNESEKAQETSNNNLNVVQALAKEKLIDYISYLNKNKDHVSQESELQVNKIKKAASEYKLILLNEGIK